MNEGLVRPPGHASLRLRGATHTASSDISIGCLLTLHGLDEATERADHSFSVLRLLCSAVLLNPIFCCHLH